MRVELEIADVLVAEATRVAAERRTTVDELVEDGLRTLLAELRERKPFKLRDGSVDGLGLKPEFAAGGLTQAIYASYERDET